MAFVRFAALLFVLCLQVWGQVVPNHYIVELDGAPALEGFRAGRHLRSRQDFESRRRAVREGQKAAVARLQGAGAKVRHQLDTIANAVFVEISDSEAKRLAALPGVKSVQPVLTAKKHLDRAHVIHKMQDAWNMLPGGPDTAGKGIKVAIIDTGVDVKHPGFVDDSLPVLAGYPKFSSLNESRDRELINPKIVVMRSYENLVDRFITRSSAMDGEGHGTGVAYAAVGKRLDGPYGPISGAAPGAYLGVYKIFEPSSGSTNSAAMLAALDDAVNDGMDVINTSVGFKPVDDDFNGAVLQRIADAGVVLVASNGNDGPGLQSASWPASSRDVLAVGSSGNSRIVDNLALVRATDGSFAALQGLPGANSIGKGRFSGTIKDAASLGGNELGCDPFPGGSLAGSLVLILRGTCTFEVKLNNAKAAGALAGIIYNPTQSDTGVLMQQGLNFSPAIWLNNREGLMLKAAIQANADLVFTADFIPDVTPDRLSSFSSLGPSQGGLQIKPDVVATGDYVVTAAPLNCCGTWIEDSGYPSPAPGWIAIDGTSFSSPYTAGAVAVLKQARPGLTTAQYRSLVVNAAAPLLISAESNRQAVPMEAGSGRLDVAGSMRAAVTVAPATVSFGGGGATLAKRLRTIKITNVSSDADTFSLAVEPLGDSQRPDLAQQSVTLDPGASADVEVSMSGDGLRAGQHHGYIVLRGTKSDVTHRVPYWYGVASAVPNSIAVIIDPAPVSVSGRATVLFRVTDSAGIALDSASPEIETVTDGGLVESVTPDSRGNGLFVGRVRAGRAAGTYRFQIKAGDVSRPFFVTAQ